MFTFGKEIKQNTTNLFQNTQAKQEENKTQTHLNNNADKATTNLTNPLQRNTNTNPAIKLMESKLSPEEELQSSKNILGYPRTKISKNVIEAVANKISLGEFYLKNSEDIYHQNLKEHNIFSKFSSFSEKKYENINIPDDDYLETKFKRQKLKEEVYITQKHRNLHFEENEKDKQNFGFSAFNKNAKQKIEEFKINEKLFCEKNENYYKGFTRSFRNFGKFGNYNYANEGIFNEKNNELIKLANFNKIKSSKIIIILINK